MVAPSESDCLSDVTQHADRRLQTTVAPPAGALPRRIRRHLAFTGRNQTQRRRRLRGAGAQVWGAAGAQYDDATDCELEANTETAGRSRSRVLRARF